MSRFGLEDGKAADAKLPERLSHSRMAKAAVIRSKPTLNAPAAPPKPADFVAKVTLDEHAWQLAWTFAVEHGVFMRDNKKRAAAGAGAATGSHDH
jgi:hypothetical protein